MLGFLAPYKLYFIAGAAIALAVGSFTAGWRTNSWRHDAQELMIQQAAQKAGDAATTAAVGVIGKLRPQFTTINGKVERETITDIRYRDCVHSPVTWGLLDSAYQAIGGQPFGGGTGVPDPAPTQ